MEGEGSERRGAKREERGGKRGTKERSGGQRMECIH